MPRPERRKPRMRSLLAHAAVALAALAAASTAAAAPAFRGMSTAKTSSSVRSVTLAKPAGVLAGDVMLAAIDVRLSSVAQITPPAGWTLVRSDSNGGIGAELTQALYVHVAGAL